MATAVQTPARIEFTNHLMFNAVLTENEDLCRRLISAVIGKEVDEIEYLEPEVALQSNIDSHGARLDVLAKVDGKYVDVEMQVGQEPDIARRCRYYHSELATRYMPKATSYRDVPTSYVIFICMNDPLDAGLPRYELRTHCSNDPTVLVEDGATSILLNACAWNLEENPVVAGLLEYALTGSSSGGLASDIAAAVDSKNLDRRWVKASMGIMTYEHEMRALNSLLEERKAQVAAAQAEIEAAQAEAQAAQAEAQAAQDQLAAIKQLPKLLKEAGRIDEYLAALDNPQLMDTLLEEFGLA